MRLHRLTWDGVVVLDDVTSRLLAALAQNPAASMAELAAGAGLSRATLFRRYPSRQDLVHELSRLAIEALVRALDRADLERGPALEALERTGREVAGLGPGLAMVALQPLSPEREAGLLEAFDQQEDRLTRLVRRGQREGSIGLDADPVWVVTALTWLTVGASDEVRRGRLAPGAVPGLVGRSLVAVARAS